MPFYACRATEIFRLHIWRPAVIWTYKFIARWTTWDWWQISQKHADV